MVDFSKSLQTDNSHLSNLTSARFVHLDGTTTPGTIVPVGQGCRVLRVNVLAKGVGFTIHSGSRQVGVFATTTLEGSYNIGAYLTDGLTIDGVSGTGSVNITFSR